MISFWCGPPIEHTNLEQYLAIKEGGFTHVFPTCGPTTVENNRRILDLCAQVGLKAYLSDSRLVSRMSGDKDARAKLDGVIADYHSYPALAGYFIGDEPGAGAFPGLAEVVGYLREKDPVHPAFINLFPNYATAGQLGAPTYVEYITRYLDTVRPFVLSYDHYHMTKHGDGGLFFANLKVAQEESQRRGLPFWNIVLTIQHFDFRNLTGAELRYEAMQTLAYGGRGVLWFTYWYPKDPIFKAETAMVDESGLRQPHYYQARRVNREILTLGNALFSADLTSVFHVGKIPPNSAGPAPANTPIRFTGTPDSLTVGLFRAPNNDTLALITNADYKNPTAFTASIAQRRQVSRLDVASGQWIKVPASADRDGTIVLPLDLPPADAILLRW